jgi:CdiI N-terminal domain
MMACFGVTAYVAPSVAGSPLSKTPRQPVTSFDPAAPWESVRPRAVVNEEGQKIQEWRVSLADVREFYVRAGQARRDQ